MVTAELAAFLETAPAMLGASADDDLLPEPFRLWGASIGAGGVLRLLGSSDAARTMSGISEGRWVTATFTDILTFRSVQAKGRVVGRVEPPGPDDAARMRRYTDKFAVALELIGHPRALAVGLQPTAVFVLSVEIVELFDQSPGPGAGAALGGLAR